MSSDQGEVDLNAMIKSDKRRKHIEKQRKRQSFRNQTHYNDRYRNRDRSRDWKRNSDYYNKGDDRYYEQKRRNQKWKYQKQLFIQSYAISASGFVSDVSLDDILKLAKGKKIINIKATLQKQDREPLQAGKDNNMNVIINFVDKNQADQFIKQYADKKIDGKNPLQFQFRRGLVTKRKPKVQSQSQQGQNQIKQQQGKKQ